MKKIMQNLLLIVSTIWAVAANAQFNGTVTVGPTPITGSVAQEITLTIQMGTFTPLNSVVSVGAFAVNPIVPIREGTSLTTCTEGDIAIIVPQVIDTGDGNVDTRILPLNRDNPSATLKLKLCASGPLRFGVLGTTVQLSVAVTGGLLLSQSSTSPTGTINVARAPTAPVRITVSGTFSGLPASSYLIRPSVVNAVMGPSCAGTTDFTISPTETNAARADGNVSNTFTLQSCGRTTIQSATLSFPVFTCDGANCIPSTPLPTASGVFPNATLSIEGPAASVPPTLTYGPSTGSTINVGTRQSIVVTPSAGSGTDSAATSNISGCIVSGIAGTSATAPPSFVGSTIAPANIELTACTRGAAAQNGLLTCQDTRGTAPPVPRVWPLTCPEIATQATTTTITISGQIGTAASFLAASTVNYAGGSTATASVTQLPATGSIAVSPINGGNGTQFAFTYTPASGATQAISTRATATISENNVVINTVTLSIELSAAAAPPGTINNPVVVQAVQADPVARQAQQPVQDICATAAAGSPERTQCDAITASGNGAAVVQALRAISSEESSVAVSSSQDNLNFVNTGASNRLSALRGGATRTSVDDIAVIHDGRSIPTGALVGALGSFLGLTQDADETAGGGLLSDRWGFFMTGIYRDGDRDSVLQQGCVITAANRCEVESGFDFDGWQALAGLDYRFSPQFVAGVAFGGGKIDAKLNGNGGVLESRSRLGTVYASYLPAPNWYIDATYARLNNRYEQSRAIDLTAVVPGSSIAVAVGDTRGRQNNVSLTSGYVFSSDSWSFTPNVRFAKGKTEVDGFAESGLTAADTSLFFLSLPKQEFDSTQFAVGFNLNRAFSLESGVFLPYLNVEMIREQDNDAFTIGENCGATITVENCVTFVRRGANNALIRAPNINISAADSSFGRAELGFTFVREGGWQFGLSYLQTFAYEYLSSRSVQFTGRIEF